MSAPKFDPFTGAQIREVNPLAGVDRHGIPDNKFGLMSIPLVTAEKRQAVMLMLYPPTELRDQPLHVIEQVVARGGQGMLKAIANEIYRSYTSDPLDSASARNVLEAIQTHVDALSTKGGG